MLEHLDQAIRENTERAARAGIPLREFDGPTILRIWERMHKRTEPPPPCTLPPKGDYTIYTA